MRLPCDTDFIAEGKIDTIPLITHTFSLADIEKVFENRRDNAIKIAIKQLGIKCLFW